MKKKVVEIYLDDNDDKVEVSFDFKDDYTIVEMLGILEWAKSVVLKTVEIGNALAEYNEDET